MGQDNLFRTSKGLKWCNLVRSRPSSGTLQEKPMWGFYSMSISSSFGLNIPYQIIKQIITAIATTQCLRPFLLIYTKPVKILLLHRITTFTSTKSEVLKFKDGFPNKFGSKQTTGTEWPGLMISDNKLTLKFY